MYRPHSLTRPFPFLSLSPSSSPRSGPPSLRLPSDRRRMPSTPFAACASSLRGVQPGLAVAGFAVAGFARGLPLRPGAARAGAICSQGGSSDGSEQRAVAVAEPSPADSLFLSVSTAAAVSSFDSPRLSTPAEIPPLRQLPREETQVLHPRSGARRSRVQRRMKVDGGQLRSPSLRDQPTSQGKRKTS